MKIFQVLLEGLRLQYMGSWRLKRQVCQVLEWLLDVIGYSDSTTEHGVQGCRQDVEFDWSISGLVPNGLP